MRIETYFLNKQNKMRQGTRVIFDDGVVVRFHGAVPKYKAYSDAIYQRSKRLALQFGASQIGR